MSKQTSQSSFSGQTATPPRRRRNAETRDREYLEPKEIEALRTVAKNNRHGKRDSLLILMAYMHGLRVKEIADLKWSQINLSGYILVNRVKSGEDSKQPLSGEEIRALRQLQRDYEGSEFVFCSPTSAGLMPLTENGIFKMIQRAGKAAKIPFPVHPHMLRHSCGYRLANKEVDTRAIQDYLGHKNIQHTVRYTKLAEGRFKGFEKLF